MEEHTYRTAAAHTCGLHTCLCYSGDEGQCECVSERERKNSAAVCQSLALTINEWRQLPTRTDEESPLPRHPPLVLPLPSLLHPFALTREKDGRVMSHTRQHTHTHARAIRVVLWCLTALTLLYSNPNL